MVRFQSWTDGDDGYVELSKGAPQRSRWLISGPTVLDNPSNGGHHCSPYGRPGPYDPTKVCNLDNNDQYYRQA